jgi:hypothetical protein
MENKIKEFFGSGSGYGSGDGSGSGYGSGDGSGDGSGYGSGSGYSSGSGYGYGSGYGSGDGYGDGYDYGYDSGYGYGYGSGYGYGTGSGYGSGSGSGYGSGDGYGYLVNGKMIYSIDDIPTIINTIKGNVARGFIVNKDMTFTKTYVVKGGGYFAHGETILLAAQSLENKIIANMDIDEIIEKFLEVTDKKKNYPAKYFFEWHGGLTGSCLQGRESFVKNKGIDLESDMTLTEFIEVCKDDYGKEVILKLEEILAAE